MKTNHPETYYKNVAQHFDEDARLFEQRFDENPVLQMIRKDFRKHTEQFDFNNVLEIGCGPGIDLCYFAGKYPDKNFYGFDVSPEMVKIANKNIENKGLKNAIAKTGSVEDVKSLFPEKQFDLIYVYFGGLNTVYDLKQTVKLLYDVASPGAGFVLTCVNRYYLLDFFVRMLKFKFSEATARFRNQWKGYSPGRDLPSNVYSSRYVKKQFQPEFQIMKRKGYSILYPPWYAARHLQKLKALGTFLWKADQLLQKSFFWNNGEYSLYLMKKND